MYGRKVRCSGDVWEGAGTGTRVCRRLELRFSGDGANECHTLIVAKQAKVSGMFRHGKSEENSVSRRNRGKGLKDATFWVKFESVSRKEGEGDEMEAEDLDEVEERFSL